jgi:hypothetical protein
MPNTKPSRNAVEEEEEGGKNPDPTTWLMARIDCQFGMIDRI